MGDWWGIFWLVFLLAGNAFFVAGEFAVVSARQDQIEPLASAGNGRAQKALKVMRSVSPVLATCQLGIMICSLLILLLSEPAIHHLLAGPLKLAGIAPEAIEILSFVLALLIVSFLHVVLGEMVPKNISFSRADAVVLWLAAPLMFFHKLFWPLTWVMSWVAAKALRLFGLETRDEIRSTFTLEQVSDIVGRSTQEGLLQDRSGAIQGVLSLSWGKVSDLVVSMEDLTTAPISITPRKLEELVANRGYSRYPLLDNQQALAGYVHVKDLLALSEEFLDMPLKPWLVRPLVSVYIEQALEKALALMQRRRTHLALVFDGSGASVGIIFLQDIVVKLMGGERQKTIG